MEMLQPPCHDRLDEKNSSQCAMSRKSKLCIAQGPSDSNVSVAGGLGGPRARQG
jgi:hypothetical protein